MECFAKQQADFLSNFTSMDYPLYLDTLFLYATAPILQKAKPSALVTVKKDAGLTWKKKRQTLCRLTGLLICELRESPEDYLVLIYDKHQLLEVLSSEKCQELLLDYGYPAEYNPCKLNHVIKYLRFRFSEKDFPHEIGILLGYPPEDVKAFIENEGKNCNCCRHWKVYTNEEKALGMFQRIDEAKSAAIKILQSGLSVPAMVDLLRTN